MLKYRIYLLAIVVLLFVLAFSTIAASGQTTVDSVELEVLYIAPVDGVPTFKATTINGSETRVLGTAVFEEDAELISATLSPDRTRIAISSRKDRTGDDYGEEEILIFNVLTGEVTYMADDPYDSTYPSWASDSQRIAFLRGFGINGYAEAVIQNLESGDEIVVATSASFLGFFPHDEFAGFAIRGVLWPPYTETLLLTGTTGLPDARNPLIRINSDGTSREIVLPLDIVVGTDMGWSLNDSNIVYGDCDFPDNDVPMFCRYDISNGRYEVVADFEAVLPPDFPNGSITWMSQELENKIALLFGIPERVLFVYDFRADSVIQIAEGGRIIPVGWVDSSFAISSVQPFEELVIPPS